MTLLQQILLIFLSIVGVRAVAKFEVTSVSDSSLVIKMIEAANVTNFDITVQIFDLSKQRLFRRTQLDHVKNDQLLSFDGLKSDTWFAVRIEYRLNFADDITDNALRMTKQEMVIKTKKTNRDDPKKIEQMVAYIDDLFVTKDNIYIGVGTVFKEIKKIQTVIVPELRCSKGILSPVSQQIVQHASFHFDLSKLPKEDRKCNTICVFPYLRLTTENSVSETFRAKEWCGSADEARHLLTNKSSVTRLIPAILILLSLALLN